MELAEIEKTDLAPSDRAILAEDRERWQRMGAGAHLDDWLAYGPGLMIRRCLAMRIAHVNKPEGRRYVMTFADLMKRGGLDTMQKEAVSALLWLHEQPDRMTVLREIRDAMSVGERARLNSPISARQRVAKVLKTRHGTVEPTARTSLKQQIADRDRMIAQLEARLAVMEKRDFDGSLFDLAKDSPENIGKTIVAHVPSKAPKIRNAIGAALERRRQKPAG